MSYTSIFNMFRGDNCYTLPLVGVKECRLSLCLLSLHCVTLLSSKAFLTAAENKCLERALWSAADILLLHNEGCGWTPNKHNSLRQQQTEGSVNVRTHTHTHTHTHIHTQRGSQMVMQEENKTRQQQIRWKGHEDQSSEQQNYTETSKNPQASRKHLSNIM